MKKKSYILIIIALLAGVLIGIQLQKVFMKKYLANCRKRKPDILMKKLDKELKLSEEQRKKAGTIFYKSYKDIQLIKDKDYSQFKVIIDRAYSDFEKVLDDKQKAKLQKLREKFKKKHDKRKKAKTNSSQR